MADILPDVIDSGHDVCINFLEALHKQREMISNHDGYSFDFKGFSESMLDGALHMIYVLRGMKYPKRLDSMKFSIDTIESSTITDFFKHFYYVQKIIFEGVPMTKSLVESIAVWLPNLKKESSRTKKYWKSISVDVVLLMRCLGSCHPILLSFKPSTWQTTLLSQEKGTNRW